MSQNRYVVFGWFSAFTRPKRVIFVIFLTAAFLGLIILAWTTFQFTMNKEQITKIAEEYAVTQGFDPQDYEVLSISEHDQEYRVLFLAKSGQPGDHFTVCVDEKTKQATRLILGR